MAESDDDLGMCDTLGKHAKGAFAKSKRASAMPDSDYAAVKQIADKQYGGISDHKGVALPDVEKKPSVDDEWVKQAKDTFVKYDSDGDGCMSKDELATLMAAISPGMTQGELNTLFVEADVNENNRIEFSEFVDWLCAPADKLTMGRAIIDKEYAKCFKCLFDAYDKDKQGVISAENFEECHCMLQGALRLTDVNDDDEHRADPLALKDDHQEAFAAMDKAGTGSIRFPEFVQWMIAHVPTSLDKQELFVYTSELGRMITNCFRVMAQAEEGFLSEKDAHILEDMIGKVAEKTRGVMDMGEDKTKIKEGQSQWTEPPMGLDTRKLQRTHMGVVPLQMKRVKPDGISWEMLCLPMPGSYDDPESRLWLAEVIRRVEYKSGRIIVEDPEYYVYDRKYFSWKTIASGDEEKFVKVFMGLTPGIGVFCLLKTAANFGIKVMWPQITNAMQGAVDMKLIDQAQSEAFIQRMIDNVIEQMIADGMGEDIPESEKLRNELGLTWLEEHFSARPREVMAVLSMLKIVEIDPAWQDFVE